MMELMLKSRAKQLKKNQKGFTLVELIVVVAILGILAVIGITRFAGLTDSARIKADTATAASLASAAQVYIAEYDGTFTGTTIPIAATPGTSDASTVDSLTGKGLIDAPKAPQVLKGSAWIINYDSGTKQVTVVDKASGGNTWYPAPAKDATIITE